MPLHKAAEEMRNLYANEIARAVHTGQQPSSLQGTVDGMSGTRPSTPT